MSCGTNRCALRRFDGHGTSSYRPSNSEASREFTSRMDQMLAERARQDQGVFVAPQVTAPPSVQAPPSQIKTNIQIPNTLMQTHPLTTYPLTCYPLSDSGAVSRRT
jgi:hypothetical protein